MFRYLEAWNDQNLSKGSKRWLDWRKEIELLSDLVYFGLTTFSGTDWSILHETQPFCVTSFSFICLICLLLTISSGNQTLGEEYVHIIQVDPTERRVPSRARRGLFVFCHVFFPYLLDKVLVCLENELEGGQESRRGVCRRQAAPRVWSLESWLRRGAQKAVALLSESQRKACLPAVFALQQGLTLLHRLHVALFYLSGSFYHLSKRASGISYVGDTFLCFRYNLDWCKTFQ